MARKKNKDKVDALKVLKGIDREIAKENNTLTVYRGRHAIHKNKSDKRMNRKSRREAAVREFSED